ncbi:MAG: Mur ligase domain-containing protein, partial [Candidatus Peribacteraceae bacterium]|nr:Mur ligase domain-containing protein [Candidatus Peribacteraceae bacterium]
MKIFCSGIGGIGLSAYAALQQAEGHRVSGSDRGEASPVIADLQKGGISVSTDQSGDALPPDTDLFIYSEAIPEDSPERKKALRSGMTQMSYPQALGRYLHGKKTIAVCGTHGKSSVTAMAGKLLTETGMDPTIVVGTRMR